MNGLYRRKGKRLVDLSGAIVGLGITAPVHAGAALAVRLKLGNPILFRQIRPGLDGKPFRLVKLRSMRELLPGEQPLGSDAERLSALGRFLRATSIDELQELWNVLRGDMSLVGPRPLLFDYLDRYTPEQARRHEVRPGITGWAQVNGRNEISWEEKLALDIWYVNHLSFWLDLRILWLTLTSVLKRQGVSAQGHPTAPEFLG